MTDLLPRRPGAFPADKTNVARAVLLQRPIDARVTIREMPVELICALLPQAGTNTPQKETTGE
ncbi:hypothetical protein M1D58_27505 (plasmid) [Pseudomonas sp. R4-76]|uniref:hypothetical protein n=1 Tax=unclassified Pseudomonas TaxID=196821 RepID=UPI003DA8BDE0